MEIKLDDLKDYVGLPLWDIECEVWRILEKVIYDKKCVLTEFTDNRCYKFDRKENTGLYISV